MSDAKNNPVRGKQTLLDSTTIPVQQRPPIDLGAERPEQAIVTAQDGDDVLLVDESAQAEVQQLEMLAFAELPVMILLQKSAEKEAPKVVDCWVNGRGAEQFVNGKWMVCGWLPVGVPVITKHKYVEVLARCKPDSIRASYTRTKEDEEQITERFTHTKYPFSVLDHKGGQKGIMALANILSEQ